MEIPVPESFAAYARTLPGLDADALLGALDTPPSAAIRLNPAKHDALTEDEPYPGSQPVEWCPEGRRLAERPVFTLNPLLHAGVFYVQDPSSMVHGAIVARLVERIGDGRPGAHPLALLDFCAAPGGKTTAMIAVLPRGSVVVANEYVPARGKILRENLEKWGYPAVIATGADSAAYTGMAGKFDIVAVDAPCSGEGMMRKDADARRQWSERLVGECAALQRSILQDVARCVRPGGYLIYSTCTFNLAEDEEMSRFIAGSLGFEPVGIDELGLPGVDRASRALLPDVEALRFMPHLTQGEGLYVSVFRRPEEGAGASEEAEGREAAEGRRASGFRKGRKPDKGKAPVLTRAQEAEVRSWFDDEWDMVPESTGEMVTALPSGALPVLDALRRAGVRVTGAGLPVATVKGTSVIPDSRAALSQALARGAFPKVELTEEEALSYLRRESLRLDEGAPRGFVAVCHKGHPLGLVKNLGTRANNLYPAAWKIHI